jgi:hypothetical protein
MLSRQNPGRLDQPDRSAGAAGAAIAGAAGGAATIKPGEEGCTRPGEVAWIVKPGDVGCMLGALRARGSRLSSSDIGASWRKER